MTFRLSGEGWVYFYASLGRVLTRISNFFFLSHFSRVLFPSPFESQHQHKSSSSQYNNRPVNSYRSPNWIRWWPAIVRSLRPPSQCCHRLRSRADRPRPRPTESTRNRRSRPSVVPLTRILKHFVVDIIEMTLNDRVNYCSETVQQSLRFIAVNRYFNRHFIGIRI